MPVKKFRPYTPTRRFTTVADFSEITKDKPERSLLKPIKKTGGRNNQGRTTSRFRGGGHKRRYRLIDFRRRDKAGIPAKVNAIGMTLTARPASPCSFMPTARSAISSPPTAYR